MNCSEVATNLQSYIDSELPHSSMETIKRHLDDCPGCGEKFEAERLFRQTLKDKIVWRAATDALLKDVKYKVQSSTIS